MSKKNPEEIRREAGALVERMRQVLADSGGLSQADMQALVAGLSERQKAKVEADLEEAIRKDMEDIEREVAEGIARLGFESADSSPGAGRPRKMRDII
ncbi:hypothetical protein ACTPOE_14650 [Castellaniella sp. WN]